MVEFTQYRASVGATAARADIDVGLRAHMLRIYNLMGGGLAVTGLVALLFGTQPALTAAIWGTPLKWVVMFAPIALMLFVSFRGHTMTKGAISAAYWALTVLMGLSMSLIFVRYTGASIAQTFFVTAAAFAGISLWAYTTKKDLSGMGTFLVMGLIGLMLAGIVNMFLGSGMLAFVISAGGVLIFSGLTAYDTQRLKLEYAESYGEEELGRSAVWGAMSLYLNFVNLFQFLLSFMGNDD